MTDPDRLAEIAVELAVRVRAAARRHRAHGEPLCEECLHAERDWDRDRKRAARASTREAA